MLIREVGEFLAQHGLQPPDLEMLRADEHRYTCLLLQPNGPIYAGAKRIGLLDVPSETRKVNDFLRLALERTAHLAVTPEYFFPWQVLKEALQNGTAPADGALWVIGCESIDAPSLEQFKTSVSEICTVLYEPLEMLPRDRELLDPVIFIFRTQRVDGGTALVGLVQFKTHPSRDATFLEEGLLKTGTAIYRFSGADGTLSAACIICSDSMGAIATDVLPKLIDRSTLIHIQLNPDPRHTVYRQYRKTAFETDADVSKCHIVCLNWAGSVVQHAEDGSTEIWPKVSGSTWYCPESRCKCDDAVVLPNHELGLYYTYMKEKRHALLFHYGEAIFELLVPKVVTRAAAISANLNGPSMAERYEWEPTSNIWQPAQRPLDTGFNDLLNSNLEAKNALDYVSGNRSVLDIERILALTAGTIINSDNWHVAKEIDSFQIDADEIVHRVTVAQDTHADASKFRHARLEIAADIRYLLDSQANWPPQVAGVDHNAKLDWTRANCNFNVIDSDERPALIVHLGHSPEPRKIENEISKFTELLKRGGAAIGRNKELRHRICNSTTCY